MHYTKISLWVRLFVTGFFLFATATPALVAVPAGFASHLRQLQVMSVANSVVGRSGKLQRLLEEILIQLDKHPLLLKQFLQLHRPLFSSVSDPGYQAAVRRFSIFIGGSALPLALKYKIQLFNADAVAALRGRSLWKQFALAAGATAITIGGVLLGWYFWPKKDKEEHKEVAACESNVVARSASAEPSVAEQPAQTGSVMSPVETKKVIPIPDPLVVAPLSSRHGRPFTPMETIMEEEGDDDE